MSRRKTVTFGAITNQYRLMRLDASRGDENLKASRMRFQQSDASIAG